MKKIGIITLYDSPNYGAFLQAYASKIFFEKRNLKVQFVCLNRNKLLYFYKQVKTKRPFLLIFKLKMYFALLFSRRHLDEVKLIENDNGDEEFDYVAIGSDTLWDTFNPTIIPRKEFVGKGIKANTIFTWAISGGSINDFKKVYGEKEKLERIDAFSVRDEGAAKLVNSLTGKMPRMITDPTLLIDKEEYLVSKVYAKEPYILVYGYSFSVLEQELIKKYAQDNYLKTYAVGLRQTWCDKNIAASAEQFLGYIHNADIVVTSTFHGTIFSLIFHKKIVVISRGTFKVRDLLKKYNLKDIDIWKKEGVNYSDFNEVVQNDIDWEALDIQIKEERVNTEQFISELGI